MPSSPAIVLRELERIRAEFGSGLEVRKRSLVQRLDRARLASPREVERLHEALAFLHAYPDGPRLLAAVRRALGRFTRRADLRRHTAALEGSGIAGTAVAYRFFYPTARWLAARWPEQLEIDWEELGEAPLLEAVLPLIAHPAELPALDTLAWTPRRWIARMKRKGEADGAFLARAIATLPMEDRAREVLYDSIDASMRLLPGPGTPSRTIDRWPRRPAAAGRLREATAIRFVRRPLAGGRPDLRAELERPPRAVHSLDARAGGELVDLARGAMIVRRRDLDAFAYADPRDVRLVDCGEGLCFAVMGLVPERRLLLESVYGWLTLKNSVPIGYVLTSALFNSAEVAYNVFDTYRGAEAAHVYGRVLAVTRHLFGADAFSIDPYQLGHENDEGLESGAWWFYRKLGFAPRDREVRRIARRELERMRRNPRHRSSLATLRRLVQKPLYWFAGASREDVLGILPLERIGLAATRYLARRFGSDRMAARRACAEAAARRLGVRSFSGWSADERRAFEQWAPLMLIVRGIERWSAAERRSAVAVVRAKGGRSENDFVRRFDAHAKLCAGISRSARRSLS